MSDDKYRNGFPATIYVKSQDVATIHMASHAASNITHVTGRSQIPDGHEGLIAVYRLEGFVRASTTLEVVPEMNEDH